MLPRELPRALSCVVVVCSLAACAEGAEQVGVADQPFTTSLVGDPQHEEITADGLGFLRPDVLTAVQAADVSVDAEFVLVSSHHFDDCNFSGGADVIRGYQADAIAALDPADPSPEADAEAIVAFGRWLHTAQDFYSHSNWIELGGQGIVEASLGPWPAWQPYVALAPSGFVLVEGQPLSRTSVTRQDDAPYPEDAIVRVKTRRSRSFGLMTGTVSYEPGNFCPASIAMQHADLNKDSTASGRVSQFEAAKAAATAQTRHEWCRLVESTRAAWGDAGVARLMAWAADPGGASACP